MRTITCLFFAVASLLLGAIANGVGQATAPLPNLAALVFGIAAVAFLFKDWPADGQKEPRGEDEPVER